MNNKVRTILTYLEIEDIFSLLKDNKGDLIDQKTKDNLMELYLNTDYSFSLIQEKCKRLLENDIKVGELFFFYKKNLF